MKIGAHVSIAGGIQNAIPNALAIGANTIQIFLSPPRNWHPSKITDNDAAEFVNLAAQNNIHPVLIHAIYLINLAADNPVLRDQSRASLIESLNTSAKIESAGVILHLGSNKTKPFPDIKAQIVAELNQILSKTDPHSKLLIETNAGQGNCIGCTFEQIAELIADVNDKSRIGVCLDTAHVFESGYNWLTLGASKIIDEFDHIIGLQYLMAIHANDSKTAFNSKADRHENIGVGQIGESVFRELLHDPRLADIPFILEVPGFGDQGPDKQNIDILKTLAK